MVSFTQPIYKSLLFWGIIVGTVVGVVVLTLVIALPVALVKGGIPCEDNQPVINSVAPTFVCLRGGPQQVVLSGSFLQVEDETSTVEFNGATVEASFSECVDLGVRNRVVSSCTVATVTLPQYDGIISSDAIKVTLPQSCKESTSQTSTDLLTVNGGSSGSGVIVFFADPPTVYNGLTVEVTIFTSGLNVEAGTVQLVSSNNTIDLVMKPTTNFNKIRADIPTGTFPGTYDVYIVEQGDAAVSCGSVLSSGITVVSATQLQLQSIDPPFVWNGTNSALTIKRDIASMIPFRSTPRGYLTPSLGNQGQAIQLAAVVLGDQDTVTSVALRGLAPGSYDLIIVNPPPSSEVGVLERAIQVTATVPPVIDLITPGSCLTTPSPFPVTITGENFDPSGVNISIQCNGNRFFEATVVGTPTETMIEAEVPSGSIGGGSNCLVTVLNINESSYFTYSSLGCFAPSVNLNSFSARTSLNVPRYRLGATSGKPTLASKFLYAVGGESNATNVLDTVESASVDQFGGLGSWNVQKYQLPMGITSAKAVNVEGFVYLIGGSDGNETLASVYRAQVLDPLATPTPSISINLDTAGSGVGSGLWFYRVSAVFAESDISNPGGESQPGETAVIQLPNIPGLQVTIAWDIIPGAVHYRVFRSPQANATLDAIQLLGTTNSTMYTDRGDMNTLVETPLLPGSLGKWHAVNVPQLQIPRESFAVTTMSTSNPDEYRIIVMGGRTSGGVYLDTYEYATVTVTEAPINKGRESQTLTAWQLGNTTLPVPSADTSAVLLTDVDNGRTGAGYLTLSPGQRAIVLSGGKTDGGAPALNVYSSQLLTDDVSSLDFTAFGANPGDYTGTCFETYPGHLSVFGGGSTATKSATLQSLTSVQNWNAGINVVANRQFHGCVKESRFIFQIGGLSFGTTIALDSTEATFT